VDIKECPGCHTALHDHAKHKLSSPPVVEQLPYKSPGTTALIAFLDGLFALPGIDHMYVEKVTMGILILIGGLVLHIVMIIPVIWRSLFKDSSQPKVCFLLKLQVIFQAHGF
jgi:TM2 domain-containing membrane protein YozV